MSAAAVAEYEYDASVRVDLQYYLSKKRALCVDAEDHLNGRYQHCRHIRTQQKPDGENLKPPPSMF
jgi:hypothetical protein